MNDFLEEKQELIDLRRYKNALDICGKGTLILVLWSLARFLMQITMDDSGIAYIRDIYDSSGVDNKLLYWAVFGVMALLVILVHAFASFSAMAEAKGKKKGYLYLAVYVLLIISSLDSLFSLIGGTSYYTLLEDILTILFEILSVAVEAGAIINSVKIKKIRKTLGGEVK